MRKLIPAACAVVALVLGGCGADTPPATPGPTEPTVSSPSVGGSQPSTSNSTAPDPTTSDTLRPASATPGVSLATCMSGTYQLVRFVSIGASSTYGTGAGGDVTLAFDGGAYTMTGKGKKPIQLTLAGQQAQLGIDGTVRGTLTTAGFQGTFTRGDASGSATLGSGVQQQKLTMEQVATVLAPNGDATLACAPKKLIMAFDSIRLELER